MDEQRMHCEGCGIQLDPSDQFCGGCGREVASTGSKESSRPDAGLRIIQGSQKGKEVQLHEDRAILGRGQDVDLFLGDPAASREHARVEWEQKHFILTDLGSSNGTFLNGVKIAAAEELSPGDLITIGETVIEFQSAPRTNLKRETAGVGDRISKEEGTSTASGKANSSRLLLWGGVALTLFMCVVGAILVGVLVILPALKPDSPTVSEDPAWPPPISTGVASIEISNMHSEDICAFALSPSENEDWGVNWLAEGEVLRSGSSMSFSIEPGILYDFIAYTCSDSVLVERYEIAIQDGANTLTVEPGN